MYKENLMSSEEKVFCNQVADLIKKTLNLSDEQVSIQCVLKNNGQQKNGLIVRSSDGNAAPTIYLNDAFREFLAGKSVEKIVEEIAAIIKTHQSKNIHIPRTYGEAKCSLYAQVINAAANKDLLKGIPHRKLADSELAVIARVSVDIEGNRGSYIVKNELLENWSMTKDEVIDQAIANTNSVQPSFMGMAEMLRETMGVEIDDEMIAELFPSEEEKMYVLTNSDKVYGASMLLNKELLATINERVGDYYIIPSSIHEVIIVPESAGVDLESLEQMVHDVNRREVAPEDVLSDKIFRFNAKTNKLEVAGQHQEQKEEKAHKKGLAV